MLGLKELRVANTRLHGPVPDDMSLLPFLDVVDIHNTLMTCCDNKSDARARADCQWDTGCDGPRLLPGWLLFNNVTRRPPLEESFSRDAILSQYTQTGANML